MSENRKGGAGLMSKFEDKCKKYEEFINAWMQRFTEIMLKYSHHRVDNPMEMNDFYHDIYFELQTFVGWTTDE